MPLGQLVTGTMKAHNIIHNNHAVEVAILAGNLAVLVCKEVVVVADKATSQNNNSRSNTNSLH